MEPVLTIAICTYNRAAYITDCLDSLQRQTADDTSFEILVVNNNSSDGTGNIVSSYNSKPVLRLIDENKQGLSHARNAAARASNTEWILYLDDDALAREDLVEKTISFIQEKDYSLFGGVYIPWYKHGKPYWMKDRYVSSSLVGHPEGELAPSQYLSGGILAIRRALLEEVGGFDPHLGMAGANTAYGEETELQNRVRAAGYAIYLKPDMVIEHLVAVYKLDVGWYFKKGYALGRDMVGMKHWSYSPWRVFRLATEAVAMVAVKLPLNTIKLIMPGYYMENLMIDTFVKVVKRAGIIMRLMELKQR